MAHVDVAELASMGDLPDVLLSQIAQGVDTRERCIFDLAPRNHATIGFKTRVQFACSNAHHNGCVGSGCQHRHLSSNLGDALTPRDMQNEPLTHMRGWMSVAARSEPILPSFLTSCGAQCL